MTKIGRSNALRQYLDTVASSGEWDFDVIKKLPIAANTPIDEVLEMRTDVATRLKRSSTRQDQATTASRSRAVNRSSTVQSRASARRPRASALGAHPPFS